MFISYTAVPVVAFTILLNLLWFCEPIISYQTGKWYSLCDTCLQSECHTIHKRPCITTFVLYQNFTCFFCEKECGYDQFYNKDDCEKQIKNNTMHCVCYGSCYILIPKDYTFDKSVPCETPRTIDCVDNSTTLN